MPSVLSKPEKFERFALRLQKLGAEYWTAKKMRAALERAALNPSEPDLEGSFLIDAIVQASACLARLGREQLKAGGLSAAERVELERLRMFIVRERLANVRRLADRRRAVRDGSGGEAPGDPLASLLSGWPTEWESEADRPGDAKPDGFPGVGRESNGRATIGDTAGQAE